MLYINNISSTSNVYVFDISDRPRGYYWNDGNYIKELTKDESVTSGIFIFNGKFSFNINDLNGGNIYQLKIYMGVYSQQGLFKTTLYIDGNQNDMFEDNSIYQGTDDTNNACYQLIIDLSTINSNKLILLDVNWIAVTDTGGGNIVIQAVALSKI